MNNKLYVGSLSYSTTEDTLRSVFSEAGTVTDARVIMDRATGRSKGFGFVEMESDEAAQKAISLFNGTDLDGRQIVVNVAQPQEERGGFRPNRPRGGGGGYGGGNRSYGNRY
jgi:RNA recognition motif-containing protein